MDAQVIEKYYSEKERRIRSDITDAELEIEEDKEFIESCKKKLDDLQKEKEGVLKSDYENAKPSVTFTADDGIKLTDEDVETLNKWVEKHEREQHPLQFFNFKNFGYQGEIFCSHYELRRMWSNVGTCDYLVCTACEKKTEGNNRRPFTEYAVDIHGF